MLLCFGGSSRIPHSRIIGYESMSNGLFFKGYGFSTFAGLDSIWKGPKSISAMKVSGYTASFGTLTESAQVKPHP